MKNTLSILASLMITSGWALAQGGNGPGGGSDTNGGHSWSNSVSQSNSYHYVWGSIQGGATNPPKTWSNQFSHAYAGQAEAGGGGQVQNRFGKTELPSDVQTIVRQFQQDRTRLMSQLKTCSDEQRQQILKDMEGLRAQLRDQIAQMRDQAREQAEQMRNRFSNNRDRILDQGTGGGGNGRDR